MLLPLLLLPAALAHRPGISVLRIDHDAITLVFAQPELAPYAPLGDLDASRRLIAQATVDLVGVRAGESPCTLDEPVVSLVEEDGVEVRVPYRCPSGDLHLDVGYLATFPAGHRVYVEVDEAPVAVLDAAGRTVDVAAPPGPWAVARRFVGLGVEHIWTGYDHLAFLFGLVLVASRLKDMLFIVTGFTVAHSLTLSAAALGLVTLPSVLVEAAIAASIVFIGIENLWKPPTRRRVVTTFTLGLIHGFGFAGLLAELGLPKGSLVVALASFNFGVELGQAAIVAVCLPLLVALSRRPGWTERAVPALSVGVSLAGLYWLAERTLLAG